MGFIFLSPWQKQKFFWFVLFFNVRSSCGSWHCASLNKPPMNFSPSNNWRSASGNSSNLSFSLLLYWLLLQVSRSQLWLSEFSCLSRFIVRMGVTACKHFTFESWIWNYIERYFHRLIDYLYIYISKFKIKSCPWVGSCFWLIKKAVNILYDLIKYKIILFFDSAGVFVNQWYYILLTL